MNISDITPENIRNGWLQKDLPEIYQLEQVWESNDAHEESTLTHTLNVFEIFEHKSNTLPQKQKEYFERTIQKYSRNDLMKLTILLHDLGKKETITMIDGKTKFPWHEEKSYEKSLPIVEKFDLSSDEKEIVLNTIRYHWLLHNVLSKRLTNDEIRAKTDIIKNEYSQIFFDMVMFDFLDTLSLKKMEQINKKEYDFRINFFETLLKTL